MKERLGEQSLNTAHWAAEVCPAYQEITKTEDLGEEKGIMENAKVESLISRRSFGKGMFGALAMSGVAMMGGAKSALPAVTPDLNDGDVAVLQFLAAAELVESDLWGQYSELASDNPDFRRALTQIKDTLPDYVNGDFADETSHASFINAFLVAAGKEPINLDAFRTLPSVPVEGARQIGRLTNLTNLTVDTSYYERYRSQGNPDFGDTFPQTVNIKNQPAVPTSDRIRGQDLLSVAQTAAFHFAAIEQGGSNLYNSLLTKVSDLNVVAILASIGPTEVYHFAIFQEALEDIVGLEIPNGPVFPDIRSRANKGQITPHPCTFVDPSFPLCSVIRPRNTNTAGAVAAATGLVNSGLFEGQSPAFFNAVTALATAADAAVRNV
jgi:hypothetical protein